TAQIEIANRDQQVRPVVMMGWNYAAGLQLHFAHTGVIFHEKNVLRAAVEYTEAALFVPFCRRLLRLLILQQFDSYVAERSIREVLRDVREFARCESSLAILQLERDLGLACHIVLHLRVAQSN